MSLWLILYLAINLYSERKQKEIVERAYHSLYIRFSQHLAEDEWKEQQHE